MTDHQAKSLLAGTDQQVKSSAFVGRPDQQMNSGLSGVGIHVNNLLAGTDQQGKNTTFVGRPDQQINSVLTGVGIQIKSSNINSSRKKSLPIKLSPSSNDRKRVQCHECGFTCTSYAQLKVHHRIHTGDKPYKCPECNYASTRNPNLQRHIASMHPGHASPSLIKRERPLSHILTSGSFRASSSGGPMIDKQIRESVSTSHSKSTLSEIRACELRLAEDTLPYGATTADTTGSLGARRIHPASQVLAIPSRIPLKTKQQESLPSLATNVMHPDSTLSQDQLTILDRGIDLRSHLIHPASQVLALPPHIPVTTHEGSSSSYESDSVIQEPIIIDDDNPTVEDLSRQTYDIEMRPEHPHDPRRLEAPHFGVTDVSSLAKMTHQILSETSASMSNDENKEQQQASPVVVMPTPTPQSRSVSPEIIPIDSPTAEPVNHQVYRQDPVFTSSLVNNRFNFIQDHPPPPPPHPYQHPQHQHPQHQHPQHQLSQDFTTANESSFIPAVSTPTAFPRPLPDAMLSPPSVGVTHAKVNPRQPLVLEIENSSIGLYLHLDLSKYLCEQARHMLSQHTHECEGVCRANFPVHTSNAASATATVPMRTTPPMLTGSTIPTEVAPPLIATSAMLDTDLRQGSFPHLQHAPIHTTNRVSTISRTPSLTADHNRAFPTAILAVPPPQQSEDQNGEPQHAQNHYPSEQNPKDLPTEDANSSKVITSEANEIIDIIPPSSSSSSLPTVSAPSEQINIGCLVTQPNMQKRKHTIGSNSILPKQEPPQSDPSQVANSLIFQRWPTLKQYMQVRCLAGNQREFSCYKCGKQFTQMHQLKVHVKNHIKRYNCQQCHYSTHRMANLRRHQLTHRQVNELTCHVCREVLANKRAYTMHVLFAHKKQKKGKDFEQWRKQVAGPISMAIASKFSASALDCKADDMIVGRSTVKRENLDVKLVQDDDQAMDSDVGNITGLSSPYTDVIIKKEAENNDFLEGQNDGSQTWKDTTQEAGQAGPYEESQAGKEDVCDEPDKWGNGSQGGQDDVGDEQERRNIGSQEGSQEAQRSDEVAMVTTEDPINSTEDNTPCQESQKNAAEMERLDNGYQVGPDDIGDEQERRNVGSQEGSQEAQRSDEVAMVTTEDIGNSTDDATPCEKPQKNAADVIIKEESHSDDGGSHGDDAVDIQEHTIGSATTDTADSEENRPITGGVS